MKIMVISESHSVLDTYSDFFTENGYDTICYSWLLKALDNVEEIKPHAVVVNSIDYPRHWKTLVQYIRSIQQNGTTMIVVVPENLESEEQKKIKALNVFCVQEDFVNTDQGKNILHALSQGTNTTQDDNILNTDARIEDEIDIADDFESDAIIEISEDAQAEYDEEIIVFNDSHNTENNDITYEEQAEAENKEALDDNRTILEGEQTIDIQESIELNETSEELYFTEINEIDEDSIFEEDQPTEEFVGTWLQCPIDGTNEIITGEVSNYNHPILLFSPKETNSLHFFTFGKKFTSCTLWDDGYKSIVTVQVQGLEDNSIELCIVK